MKRQHIVLLVLLVLAAFALPRMAHATDQMADGIQYEGQVHWMFSYPLEQYFTKEKMRPFFLDEGVRSTICRRGYRAVWEIKDKKLFLKSLEKEYLRWYPVDWEFEEADILYRRVKKIGLKKGTEEERALLWKRLREIGRKKGAENDHPRKDSENDQKIEWREIPLSVLFLNAKGEVFAKWFSGTLTVPQGKIILRCVRRGCDPIYERDILIKISKGIVEEIKEIDNKEILELEQLKLELEQLKKGRRFIAYPNGVVFDSKTGLEWIVGPDKDTTWDEAKSWVQSLDTDGGGWRMPTMDELEGYKRGADSTLGVMRLLRKRGRYKREADSQNITPLLKTTGWWVWSGETKGSSGAWGFNFRNGHRDWITRGHSRYGRAFAVRSRSDG